MKVQPEITRAGDGTRTHDSNVGNVALYQLSYTRLSLLLYAPQDSGQLFFNEIPILSLAVL